MKEIKSKSDITKEIARLRDYGYIVLCFQNNKIGRRGTKSMTDNFVVGRGKMYFLEGKFKEDPMSDEQIKFMNEISFIERLTKGIVKHTIVTEKNVCEIVDKISSGVL
jgi:hypothetical protein